MDAPETRYARTLDGLSLAYWEIGDGPVDLLYLSGFMGNLEVMWEQPLLASFFGKLASSTRLIYHDRRATGLSDRATSLPSLETQIDDIRTVLDTAASQSTVILGVGWGTYAAALFASTHPNRTRALILLAGHARTAWAPDYPWGFTEDVRARDVAMASATWGTEAYAAFILAIETPSMVGDREFVRWYAKLNRHWVAPSAAAAFAEHFYELDIRHVLPTIRVPTLVIAREWGDPEEDEYVSGLIPDSRLLRLPTRDRTSVTAIGGAMAWVGDQDGIVEAVQDFAGVARAPVEADRALATVLFTDIVASTDRAAELGDRAWAALLEDHHRRVRALLTRHRGREHNTTGDGFFASFDGPARGIRCALEIVDAVKELGIEIRAGLHTGEVETIDRNVGGIAVATAARIAATAQPSEILVSQTVKDLVAGSGLVFEDAGEHELKGVPDRWRLYRATRD